MRGVSIAVALVPAVTAHACRLEACGLPHRFSRDTEGGAQRSTWPTRRESRTDYGNNLVGEPSVTAPEGERRCTNEAVRSMPTCRTRSTRTSRVQWPYPAGGAQTLSTAFGLMLPVCSDTPEVEVGFGTPRPGAGVSQSTPKGGLHMGGMRTFLALMLEPLSHPKGEQSLIP